MKSASFLINIVLALAVGYLYYLHFVSNNSAKSAEVTNDSTQNEFKALPPKEIKPNKIVYVNTDSLIDQLSWAKDVEKEAMSKQSRLEKNYKEKGQKYQEDYMMYQEKIQKGELSMDAAKMADEEMKKRGEELAEMEAQLQDLQYEVQKKNLALKQEVTSYLQEYNKTAGYNYILSYSSIGELLFANDSLDITSEVVAGLNERYKQKKSTKNK